MDMDYAIAKMSTKGQIVIPKELRSGLAPGDEFLIIKDEDRIVLKRMESVADELREDLAFAQRVEEAWKRHDTGTRSKRSASKFLGELERW